MTLIQEYLDLTSQYSKEYGDLTIILMQNGAFFESYGLKDDAENVFGCKLIDFSKICDLNIVDKKLPGGSNMMINNYKVVNAGFKIHLIDKYLKKLQDNGFTIVVFEEDGEIDPTTNRIKRIQTGIYSPGTYFCENDHEILTNNVVCLWIEIKKTKINKMMKNMVYIGISVIDNYTGVSYMSEIHEEYNKNPTTFDSLENYISIYNPTETIVISNLSNNEIKDVVSFINIKSKSIHMVELTNEENKNTMKALKCEKQNYQKSLLNQFYKINDIDSFMLPFYDNVYATQSFCFLLDFIYLHNPHLIEKISEPIFETNNNKLILANHSLKQLNIIDDNNGTGKYSSIVKMLNECLTPMGKRMFIHKFLNPVTDISYLETEYTITEYILSHNFDYNYGQIKQLLNQVKDIKKTIRHIFLQKASPKLLYQLYKTCNIAFNIHQFVSNNYTTTNNNILLGHFVNFVSLTDDITKLNTYLENHLILNLCQNIDNISKIDESFIKSGVDVELDTKLKTLMESQDQLTACRDYFHSLIEKYETNKSKKPNKKTIEQTEKNDEDIENKKKYFVNIDETEKSRFKLLATNRRCKLIEELIKNKDSVELKYKSTFSQTETNFTLSLDITFDKVTTSNLCISNNQIETLCKNVTQIKLDLLDVITRVYQTRILCELQLYQNNIDNICDFITSIDLCFSKAFIANKYNYCKPIIKQTNKSFVKATELRHCLIENLQQDELYVSNDVELGNNVDGILLYGTNAVGKTSFIKSIGISIIMAQAGLYVPASSFIFNPYKCILTRILGNDNIFKRQSTFEVEMSELNIILRKSNEFSLVLGDELCSGTESTSAIGLFVSGMQELSELSCSFIFATHLHEIVNYDEIVSLNNVVMKHMSVVYNSELDCLVYNRKLQDGPGTSMYGLEVCKSLNLPQKFLENALKVRNKYYKETTSVLEQKQSHFNSKHIQGGICEKCKQNIAVDVHHLIYQNEANEKGIIKQNGLLFNKNNKANLLNLCEECHDLNHKEKKKYKKTKTTNGMILTEIL